MVIPITLSQYFSEWLYPSHCHSTLVVDIPITLSHYFSSGYTHLHCLVSGYNHYTVTVPQSVVPLHLVMTTITRTLLQTIAQMEYLHLQIQ